MYDFYLNGFEFLGVIFVSDNIRPWRFSVWTLNLKWSISFSLEHIIFSAKSQQFELCTEF